MQMPIGTISSTCERGGVGLHLLTLFGIAQLTLSTIPGAYRLLTSKGSFVLVTVPQLISLTKWKIEVSSAPSGKDGQHERFLSKHKQQKNKGVKQWQQSIELKNASAPPVGGGMANAESSSA